MLRKGFMTIATAVKQREMHYQEIAKQAKFTFFGATSDAQKEDNWLVGCFFHWFGVSVCNYARLVGFLRGLVRGQFTRADLRDSANFPDISKAIKQYVDSVPELAKVLVWRNKVAGHFAITDPRKDDNIATLNMSVMHPVSLNNGLYYVGAYTYTQTGLSGTHTSALPEWSLSQVFESLIPRYWPQVKFEMRKPEDRSKQATPGVDVTAR